MSQLLTFGIPSALIYLLKRHARDSARLIGAALILTSLISVGAIALGETIIPRMLHQYGADVLTIARLFVFTVPLALLFYVCANVFEAYNKFSFSNTSRLGGPLITLCGLVGFAVFHKLNVSTAAISYAAPSLPVALLMLRGLFQLRRPLFSFAPEPYRKLLSFGLRTYAVEVLRTLGTQIDQILVVGFLSPAKMGLYVVALSAAAVLQVVQTSVSRVLLPRVAARPLPVVMEAVGRAARVTTAITFVLALILIAFGPLLLNLLYGPKFIESYQLLRILAVEALFSSVTITLAQAFAAVGRPGTIALFQVAGLLVGIPLLILLIPRFGLIGAGLALLIATVLRLVTVLVCYPLLIGAAPPRLLLRRDDLVEFMQRIRHTAPTTP